MRKLLAAAFAVASLSQITPSSAQPDITYTATALPCLVTCHNWLPAEAGFHACGDQPMGGNNVGYHSKKFKLSAGGEVTLSSKPSVDWDFWVCTNVGGTEEAEIAHAANEVAAECESPVGSSLVAIACFEEVTITYAAILTTVGGNAALAANGFEVRSYNWSDTGEVPVTMGDISGTLTAL